MRTRLALAATTAVIVSLATPGHAGGSAPQIIDPAGDANGLSTVMPYSDRQTPEVSQADADVTSVRWQVVKEKKKVIGFTVQATLSAAPGSSTSLIYRMLGTPACGAQFGVVYNSNPAANPHLGPRSAVRDTCTPNGQVRYTAIPFPKIVGATMTWTVPLAAIPEGVNIVPGTTITDLRFGVYTTRNHANLGFETYLPVMDDGRTKTTFRFT